MTNLTQITVIIALVAMSLTACTTGSQKRAEAAKVQAKRTASAQAENTCITAAKTRTSARHDHIDVIASGPAGANSEVWMKAGGKKLKCVVTDGGGVIELNFVN